MSTNTLRPVSPGAESYLGKRLPCLDHGYVELIDYMGTDRDIALAARTTTGVEDTKTPNDDRHLIRYLVRHVHTTPCEMVRARFRIQMPIMVARQLIRHRMSSTNEYSLRYSEPIDLFYVPAAEHVGAQSTSNRQGRGETLPPEMAQKVRELIAANDESAMRLYRQLADEFGLARELARTVLPVNLYTRWVWTIDLHNLSGLLKLRLDGHAQYEIRVFAQALAEIVKAWLPVSYEALVDYRLEARTFSKWELVALAVMLGDTNYRMGDLEQRLCAADAAAMSVGLGDREREELKQKLRHMANLLDAVGQVEP